MLGRPALRPIVLVRCGREYLLFAGFSGADDAGVPYVTRLRIRR